MKISNVPNKALKIMVIKILMELKKTVKDLSETIMKEKEKRKKN